MAPRVAQYFSDRRVIVAGIKIERVAAGARFVPEGSAPGVNGNRVVGEANPRTAAAAVGTLSSEGLIVRAVAASTTVKLGSYSTDRVHGFRHR